MSAYIVNPEHIRELAAFAVSRYSSHPGGGHENVSASALRHCGGKDMHGHHPEEVARYFADVLYQENIRSVRTRYPNLSWDDLPGLIMKPIKVPVSYSDICNRRVQNPVYILTMCDGLEYQSCETADYYQTPAYELLQQIRKAAISQLPGYDDGPWCYEERAA